LSIAGEELDKAAVVKEDTRTYARAVHFTWQLAYEEHRRAVSEMSNRVDDCCLKSDVVANQALLDAAATERYGSDARGHAAVAAKEALLEQDLRVTDFHDESSVAWAALDRFQSSAKDAFAAASVTLRELEDTNALAASKGGAESRSDIRQIP
jgi:hypothetical protein